MFSVAFRLFWALLGFLVCCTAIESADYNLAAALRNNHESHKIILSEHHNIIFFQSTVMIHQYLYSNY